MPSFFIPLVDAAHQEEAYHGMAAFVGGVPLPSHERIYSITFRHDGEVWTATVGERMKGKATATSAVGRERAEPDPLRWSADTVIAIYAGGTVPYLIAHDGAGRNRWNMPIWVRDVLNVTTFD